MTGELAARLLEVDLEIPCPTCRYPVWARWVEVTSQTIVRCPCCRTRIWLRDGDGRMHNAARDIRRVLR